MLTPTSELQLLAAGNYRRIVGIDEVGRGCWAGPVAVGAYVFDGSNKRVRNVHDSKLLNPQQRQKVYSYLVQHNHTVEFASVNIIDKLGIGSTIATLISQLISYYNDGTTLFLVDGRFKADFGEHVRKLIDGDANYYTIAAASILAKVERDRVMAECEHSYPGYEFGKHKGYGTRKHAYLISCNGICDLHRRSFAPIKAYL